MRSIATAASVAAIWLAAASATGHAAVRMESYALPAGAGPHDVAPAPDGTVWYTAQRAGALGRLDPRSGKVRQIALGAQSHPHGVIIGPDGAPWVTDGGLNAIVRVDPETSRVRVFPLPKGREDANLNTATFDHHGVLWFTGQSGIYGRLDRAAGSVQVFDAPRGAGPYGMTTTPSGAVFFASLAGSYVGRIDVATGKASVIEPPTPRQGARRVWSDAAGGVWVSEWLAGRIARNDSTKGTWQSWAVPGAHPAPYAIYVDERGEVWFSDWGNNSIGRFDPARQTFTVYPLKEQAGIRQMAGRKGEVWAAESGTDRLTVLRFE